MTFQLVLQWPASSLGDFDEMVAVEDLLIAKLSQENKVDGHDFGSGETNIFVLTDEPEMAFREIRAILAGHRLWESAAAAYRQIDADEYHVLWPNGATTFNIQ